MGFVPACKSHQRFADSLAASDYLEQLAHFGRTDQLGHGAVAVEALRCTVLRLRGKHFSEPAVHQESRLRQIAGDIESRFETCLRHGSEVDVRGDVVESGPPERIAMRMMTVMAHQCAA